MNFRNNFFMLFMLFILPPVQGSNLENTLRSEISRDMDDLEASRRYLNSFFGSSFKENFLDSQWCLDHETQNDPLEVLNLIVDLSHKNRLLDQGFVQLTCSLNAIKSVNKKQRTILFTSDGPPSNLLVKGMIEYIDSSKLPLLRGHNIFVHVKHHLFFSRFMENEQEVMKIFYLSIINVKGEGRLSKNKQAVYEKNIRSFYKKRLVDRFCNSLCGQIYEEDSSSFQDFPKQKKVAVRKKNYLRRNLSLIHESYPKGSVLDSKIQEIDESRLDKKNTFKKELRLRSARHNTKKDRKQPYKRMSLRFKKKTKKTI